MLTRIWQNRVARWALIFIAFIGWNLLIEGIKYANSESNVTLWIDAANVRPYLDPDTRQVVNYGSSEPSVWSS